MISFIFLILLGLSTVIILEVIGLSVFALFAGLHSIIHPNLIDTWTEDAKREIDELTSEFLDKDLRINLDKEK